MVKIFIGGINDGASVSQLQTLFEEYGSVSECAILTNFGFVHMDDEGAAKRAVKNLDGMEFAGGTVKVELSHGKSSRGGRGGRGGFVSGGVGRGAGDDRVGSGGRGGRGAADDRWKTHSDRPGNGDLGYGHGAERDDYYKAPHDHDHERAKDPYSRYPAYERDPYDRDPYPRDAYPRDPYEREPYARDPYHREPYGRDPYARDPYERDPYARDPYERDPYPRERDPHPYDYEYSRRLPPREPYARRPPARDPYSPPRDPYASRAPYYGSGRDPYARERSPVDRRSSLDEYVTARRAYASAYDLPPPSRGRSPPPSSQQRRY